MEEPSRNCHWIEIDDEGVRGGWRIDLYAPSVYIVHATRIHFREENRANI